MAARLKRQNFNVTPEEDAELNRLRDVLDAASVKDAVLRAARVLLTLSQEVREGKRVYSAGADGRETRLLLPDIEAPIAGRWKYLAPRPHAWKSQLFVKGHRLTAANVWYDMEVNRLNAEQAADAWDLPLDAIDEIVRYCELNRDLIAMEADEERRQLRDAGIAVDPNPAA